MSKIQAKKLTYHAPITQELLDDSAMTETFAEIAERLERERVAFDALPPSEQARILAERKAKAEAEKLARTCEHCGCDPDEHGGY